MKKDTNSRSHQAMFRFIDVALKTYYRVEHIQQHKTQQICSVEPVQSSKPIIPPHNITPISSIETILLCVVFASRVVRLTVYIFGRKRS
jgi:hypothetical protein